MLCTVLFLSLAVSAQRSDDPSAGHRQVNHARNPAVVVIGSAAKGTWAVTTFTLKTVAKPVAKTIFVKATPAVAKFTLKTAAKEAVPLMLKVALL